MSGCPDPERAPADRWGACPDYSEFAGVPAECTFLEVPLNRASPGRTIDLFVARVRGSAPESAKRGQVWFITGGPGASVLGFVKQSRFFAELRPEWDFYSLEQRGVGNSAPLACEAAEGESIVAPEDAPACLAELQQAWPEGIGDFTVTNTAHDLAQVIDMLREPDREVVVYGVSYGTYLLQRYLALHGEQPDAVILDSIAAAGHAEYDTFDRNMNDAARMIMERCGGDAGCSQRLSGLASDPFAAMGLTLDRLDQGTLCAELQAQLPSPLTRDDLRTLFGTMTEQVPLRALMPATVLRLNRCRSDDVAALETLINPILFPDETADRPPGPGPNFVPHERVKSSPVLYSHIVLSELWAGTSLAAAEREAQGLYASLETATSLARLADAGVWPTYDDPSSGLHSSTEKPVLMLNAELDPQTPLADALRIRDDLSGPNQTFVTVPGAGHIVLLNSLMAGEQGDTPDDHCGTRVTLSFLDDPHRAPDTSCISGVQPLTFDANDPGNRASSLEHFGTDDMWGDTPPLVGQRCIGDTMRGRTLAVGLVVASGVACGSDAPGPVLETPLRTVTFRELLQLRRPTAVEISPDGSRVAFVLHFADLAADVQRSELWLVDAAGGDPQRVSADGTDVGAMRWAPDGGHLAFVAADDAGSRIELVDPSGTPAGSIPGAAGIGELSWAPDGARLVFTSPGSDPALPQLWTVELATGRTRRLVDERAVFTDPQWSPAGDVIASIRFPADVQDARFFPTLELVDVATGSARTVAGPGDYVSSPRWSPDGSQLAYLAHPGSDEQHRGLAFDRLQVLPVAGGAPRVLAPNIPFIPRRPAWSADGATIFFEAFSGETGQLFSVASSGGDAVALSDVQGVAYIASHARDGTMALVFEDAQTPPEIHVSPAPSPFEPRRLTDFNRSLREAPAGEGRIVRWTSDDGLEVSGVLLLPPGFREGTPVPTLVVSHGGPATLVVLSYPESWLLSGAPAWTSEGWAVFFPNYRGSTNRDEAFAFAEIGQVGRGDFADVMSGVDALVQAGIADPERLAHSGWSFGGYLSGWAATHTSAFKAIVAGAGPYDWTTTYPDSEDQFILRSYLEGTPATNPDRYREASVSTWVDDAHTPVLLFGASDDDLVPPGESRAFFDALQARGVESVMRIFPEEGHELQRPSHQLEKLEREREWLLGFVPTTK